MTTYTATKKDAGERLDIVLRNHLPLSRSKVQKHIKQGNVRVNDAQVTAHEEISAGDVISYSDEMTTVDTPEPAPAPELDIVFETDDVLVINKPAGLLVHGAPGLEGEPTVAAGVVAKYPNVKDVGQSDRPGIVHRLDRDVSGVMAIAKTPDAYTSLKKQFKNRNVEKEYLALVYGQTEKNKDEITFKIARSKRQGKMVARPESQAGKEAKTVYEVVERYATATYVRVRTLTGRTHQIRVHFQAIGHPLVGDGLHTIDLTNINRIDTERIFLHAHKIAFSLPDGTKQTVTAPLPEDLENILKQLPKE